MTIKHYLAYIKSGKAINFSRFISLLPLSYGKQKHTLFDVQLVSPQKWKVSCTQETLDKLERLTITPKTRIEAAEQGDSHKIKVSSGFLLVYHQVLEDSRPDVVYLEQESYLQGFDPKHTLLIVENEENFFLPNLMLKLASTFTGQQCNLTNTDIVLGSGNRATSELRYNWYRQYKTILCAFDYDTAGLKMYRTLKLNLAEQIVHFLQPTDYSQYEACFRMPPKSHSQLLECIQLAEELGFLELSATVKKERKFMEQEILLVGLDDE